MSRIEHNSIVYCENYFHLHCASRLFKLQSYKDDHRESLVVTSRAIQIHIHSSKRTQHARTYINDRRVITAGTRANANVATRGRIVEWQRRRSFYGAMDVAYKSPATCNERSFSLVSSLKSLPAHKSLVITDAAVVREVDSVWSPSNK